MCTHVHVHLCILTLGILVTERQSGINNTSVPSRIFLFEERDYKNYNFIYNLDMMKYLKLFLSTT